MRHYCLHEKGLARCSKLTKYGRIVFTEIVILTVFFIRTINDNKCQKGHVWYHEYCFFSPLSHLKRPCWDFNVKIALCLVMVAMFSCVEETAQLCFCAVEMNANLWFSWCREGHCFYVGARLELVALPKPHAPPSPTLHPTPSEDNSPGSLLSSYPLKHQQC